MYINLKAHIYMAMSENTYYVLDLKKNKFFMLSSSLNKFLQKYLIKKNKLLITNKKDQAIYQQLIKFGILRDQLQCAPEKKHIDKKFLSESVARVEWRIPYNSRVKRVKMSSIIYEIYTIIKVRLYLKLFGFDTLINLIKKQYKNKIRKHTQFSLGKIAIRVTQASFYVPFQIKCLEWSISYILVALHYGQEVRLVFGLQRFPFISHAWVENKKGKVIFDDPKLNHSLSRILCEPF